MSFTFVAHQFVRLENFTFTDAQFSKTLSAAGAIIPAAVTMARIFLTVSNDNSSRKNIITYFTFSVRAWAHCTTLKLLKR